VNKPDPIRPSMLRDSELPSLPSSPGVVPPETRRVRHTALGVALVLAFLAAAWVASSLWVGLMLGMVMAFTAQPAYRNLVARFRDKHRHLAAGAVTLGSGLLTCVLGAGSLYLLARELLVIVGMLKDKMAGGAPSDLLGPRLSHLLQTLHIDEGQVNARLRDALSAAQGKAAAAAAIVFQTATGAALGLMLALITEFYMLLEWPSIARRLECVLPLDPRHTRALMLEFRDVGRSAFVGTVATALIQGGLAAIGYAIAGVATPITWGLVTAMASLLPVVGTFLVWLPVAGYEAFQGHFGWALFLLLWGFLVVSITSDYVIRPRLVGNKGHGHPFLMLIALLGGIEVMGLAGLIVAPIVMSLFLAVLRIYEREAGVPRSIVD
jgi:predicted PurR-regulated permease PerM